MDSEVLGVLSRKMAGIILKQWFFHLDDLVRGDLAGALFEVTCARQYADSLAAATEGK